MFIFVLFSLPSSINPTQCFKSFFSVRSPMSERSRRRVTYAQLDTLWEFLNEHRDIATGYNKSARARDTSKRMWENIAESLNAHGDGAVKDWKGWSKYWNDYKSKLKKTVAAIRCSLQRTGGGPSDAPRLSEVEQKFLQILGDAFGSGLPGVRVEPFSQESETQRESESQSLLGSTIILENIQDGSPQPGPSRLAVTPPPGPSRLAVTPPPGPSRLFVTPPRGLSRLAVTPRPGPSRLVFTPPSHPHTPTQSPRPSPRRSPRARIPAQQQPVVAGRGSPPQRARRRRREPPMSQETARRTLIDIAREGNETLRAGLKDIAAEIKAVKELLQTRLPVPELPATPHLNLP